MCGNHTTCLTVLCSVKDGILVQRDNMGSTELALFIWVTWWVNRIKAQEEQVVVFNQFFDVMLYSSQIMIAIGQLHAVSFQCFGP